MLSADTLNHSADLAYRLKFWLGDEVMAEHGPQAASTFPGPASWSEVETFIGGDSDAVAYVVPIAERFRSSVKAIVDDGPFDTDYYKKSNVSGTHYQFKLMWQGTDCDTSNDRIIFVAEDYSAAVLSMLRFVIAQQAAYPEERSYLRLARLTELTLGAINEFGQVFYGEPRPVFDWERTMNRKAHGISLDAAILIAAATYSSEIIEALPSPAPTR